MLGPCSSAISADGFLMIVVRCCRGSQEGHPHCAAESRWHLEPQVHRGNSCQRLWPALLCPQVHRYTWSSWLLLLAGSFEKFHHHYHGHLHAACTSSLLFPVALMTLVIMRLAVLFLTLPSSTLLHHSGCDFMGDVISVVQASACDFMGDVMSVVQASRTKQREGHSC
jgi:hypothetical protein